MPSVLSSLAKRCVFLSCFLTLCRAQTPEFVSLASAQPVLAAMCDSLPPGLKSGGAITPGTWNKWVRRRDREIRDRAAQGEELTLSNLLRLGVPYTKEPRIDYSTLGEFGHSAFANQLVENRANDLIRALAARAAPMACWRCESSCKRRASA